LSQSRIIFLVMEAKYVIDYVGYIYVTSLNSFFFSI